MGRPYSPNVEGGNPPSFTALWGSANRGGWIPSAEKAPIFGIRNWRNIKGPLTDLTPHPQSRVNLFRNALEGATLDLNPYSEWGVLNWRICWEYLLGYTALHVKSEVAGNQFVCFHLLSFSLIFSHFHYILLAIFLFIRYMY